MDRSIAARNLMQRSDLVCVSTIHPDGFPEARMLFNLVKLRAAAVESGPAKLPSFGNWLGTNTSSRKVAQLHHDPRLCLYYSDAATFEGLCLQGTVEDVRDPAIRQAIWTDAWEMYYPGGREGGDFTLLRFQPLKGRYYQGLQVTDLDLGA
jgi:general stress protein 26